MTADAVADAWMETCLIEIQRIGDTEKLAMMGITETVDIDFGEKGVEGKPLTNGGRVMQWKAEDDGMITLEGYPLQAGTIDSTSTGVGWADLMHTQDTTQPIRILSDHNRDKLRVLILWTNDTSATTASASTAANKSGFRVGLAEAYCVSVTESFTDGILKVTAKFKAGAFDKSNNSNKLKESVDGTSTLPAIAAYTTSNKFG